MIRFISLLFVINSFAIAAEYHVIQSEKNEVKFISDAPVESFEGVTKDIDGYLYFEEDDFTKNSQLYFEVDLRTLDTGIGLRNRHMRDNYLHTDQYPLTHYKGKIVRIDERNDDEYNVFSEGTIFIHGIEKPLTVEATMTKQDKKFRIRSTFIVKLSDFNIDIPSIMFYKIDENMDIQVDFFVKLFEESN